MLSYKKKNLGENAETFLTSLTQKRGNWKRLPQVSPGVPLPRDQKKLPPSYPSRLQRPGVMVTKVWWHKSAGDELEILAVGLVAEPVWESASRKGESYLNILMEYWITNPIHQWATKWQSLKVEAKQKGRKMLFQAKHFNLNQPPDIMYTNYLR